MSIIVCCWLYTCISHIFDIFTLTILPYIPPIGSFLPNNSSSYFYVFLNNTLSLIIKITFMSLRVEVIYWRIQNFLNHWRKRLLIPPTPQPLITKGSGLVSTFPIHYGVVMGPILCRSPANSHSCYILRGATALSYTRQFHSTPPQPLTVTFFLLSLMRCFLMFGIGDRDVLLRVKHSMLFVLTQT